MDLITQKRREKANEFMDAMSFIEQHPALSNAQSTIFGNSLFFFIYKVCKNGELEPHNVDNLIQIRKNSPHAHKFTKEFEALKEDEDYDERFSSIDVNYETLYGEPWIFDHLEYGYELQLKVFKYNNPYERIVASMPENWDTYVTYRGEATNFEDMVIDAGHKAKEYFGDWSVMDDFITDKEKLNNEHQSPFFFKKIEGSTNSSMEFNELYCDVNDAIKNLRWLKWFIETDYCKNNLTYAIPEFQSYISNLDNIPENRIKLLG